MAGDRPVFEPGFVAGGDLSSSEFLLARLGSTEGQVVVCDGATDDPVGSLYDVAESNEAGAPVNLAVPTPGHPIKVKVGAAGVTPGKVGTDGSGKLINKTADQDRVIGYVKFTHADGDIAIVHALAGFDLGIT